MQEKRFWVLFVLLNFSLSAQIKGVVKDSISGKGITYVNIWVEDENSAATSSENGEFSIKTTPKSKYLIFSAIGYDKQKVALKNASLVLLKLANYQLEPVIITKKQLSKEIEIGKNQNQVFQSFDNGPQIETKFFLYNNKYKKTKFIKQIKIKIDSHIENATAKIHLYSADENGFPGNDILQNDLIFKVNKGVKDYKINVLEHSIVFPKNGLFVGFEKLLIESNKEEIMTTDYNTNTTKKHVSYYPFLLYNYVEKEFMYAFSGGKWHKEAKQNNDGLPAKMMVFEPALFLILTN